MKSPISNEIVRQRNLSIELQDLFNKKNDWVKAVFIAYVDDKSNVFHTHSYCMNGEVLLELAHCIHHEAEKMINKKYENTKTKK